jgi:hypothetical protein
LATPPIATPDLGSKAPGSCNMELEPNDARASATPLDGNANPIEACGAIQPGSDVDYYVFTLNAGTGRLTASVSATGDAQATLIAPDGTSAQTGAGGGPGGGKGGGVSLQAVPGTWYIGVRSAGGEVQTYEVTVDRS